MATRTRFVFGTQVCGSLSESAGGGREWLLTDGTGGYATGTVAGLRTRRSHALLTVPDPARLALVALDPVLLLHSGARVELAVHEWASGAVAPRGHHLIESFDLTDGLPRWRWRVGDVVIERELAMERGRCGIAVVHRLLAAPGPVRLTLAALCTWRAAAAERTTSRPLRVAPVAGGAVVEDAYRIRGPGWRTAGEWYYGAVTRLDRTADRPPVEDLWHAGEFAATLAPGAALEVSAWAGDLAAPPPPATDVVAAARRRARRVVLAAKPRDDIDRHLALAADAHITATPAVVAGFPAAGPSERAALAGYEGLFLETGRAAEGRALLSSADRPPRDAAEVPLWYVHAVERHVTRTGDTDLAAELVPALDALVGALLSGARPGVRTDPADGLLLRDAEPTTPAWLAALAGVRAGKPVEVNALWVNALGALARLREAVGLDATALRARYETARTGFAKRYPAPTGWLYDIVDAPPPPYPLAGSRPYDDPVLRPHQLLAWALPYGPLDGADPGPLHAVGAQLLTPLGLRSLAPSEYGYAPDGGLSGPAQVPARDEPGHDRGVAWPWLLGPYAAACRRAGLPTDGLLDGLTAHLAEWGLGSVAEAVTGEPPYRPVGRPFDARSVAALLAARRLPAAPRPAQGTTE
jgi:glycogen debranching enzyme